MRNAVRNKGVLLVSKRTTLALLGQHIQVKNLGIQMAGTLSERGLVNLRK